MGITKIFLDTCIIIYIVEKHPIHASKIEALMNGLNDDVFCFSPGSDGMSSNAAQD